MLFHHVDNMVCTLDLEGRFTSVNAAGERLTGFQAQELVGRLAVELIAPEHRDKAVAQFRRRLESKGELPGDETLLVARDGRCMPIGITSALLFHDGEPCGVLGLVRDLSERQGAEEALRESEQRFRNAFAFAAIGVALIAPDGRFLQVNDSLCELVGCSADELCTIAWREITHPDDLDVDRDLVRQLLAGEIRSYQVEKRYVHRDGHDVWAQVTVSLVRARDGEPLHLISQIQDITERKRGEDALAQSEARLAEAQRIGQIGDWRRDGPDHPLTWSEETYRIFGIDPASGPPTFERLLAAIHPDDREEFERITRQCRKDGKPYSNEYRVVLPDGTVRWVHGRGELVAEEGSATTRGTAQDITERKEVEERLAEAQRIAQIGNWEWNVATDTITWSDELYRIFGLDPHVDLPSSAALREFVHPDDRARVEGLAARIREAGEAYTHQYRIVLRDGTTRWLEGRGVATVGEHGLSMHGTVQDITEDKAAEERLVEAELALPDARRAAPARHVRPSARHEQPEHLREPAGRAHARLSGGGVDDESRPAGDDRPPRRPRACPVGSGARPRARASRFSAEYRYVKPDGSIVWVQDETHVVCDEAGEPQCVQGYLLDITERKLAEEERDRLREELHHAQKLEAVGRLAGGVAHDFNNMLTAIKGYSELLLDSLEPGSPQRAEAEQIHRAAAQASALPRAVARLQPQAGAGAEADRPERGRGRGDRLIRLLVGGDVELVASPLARPAAVVADPGQVEQVLVNLATNARDAMPAGGTLTIATGTSRSARRLPASTKRRRAATSSSPSPTPAREWTPRRWRSVFEPFFTTKGVGRGSGLGLASAYGISRRAAASSRRGASRGRARRSTSTFRWRWPGRSPSTTRPPQASPARPCRRPSSWSRTRRSCAASRRRRSNAPGIAC